MKSKSIKFKIIIFFALVFILPMGLLMALSLNRLSKATDNDLKRNLDYTLSLYRDALEDNLDTLKIRAKTLAEFDFFELMRKEQTEKEEINTALQNELARSRLDYIAIVNNQNDIIHSEGSITSQYYVKTIVTAMCHTPLSSNLYVLNNEAWFFASAKISKLLQNESTHIVIAQKMAINFGDKLKRLTGAEYSLQYNSKQVISTKMDQYGRREVDINIQSNNKPSGVLQLFGKKYYYKRETALPGKIDEAIKIEINIPDSEYEALRSSMEIDFVLFAVIGIILALITGSLLSVNIAAPINKLADNTTKVANGDFTIDSKMDRSDEIGILAKNFNEMVIGIKKEKELKEQRMNELNTLFTISNAVNYFTNSEELLKFVLTHAIEVLGAERGSIMLLDDKTDELTLKVASGGKYRAVQSSPIKLGQGICGIVAQTGEGIICNEGFKDKRFTSFNSLMSVEDIITLVCAPLKFKEGTIGVINIVNKRNGGKFNENELSLLNLIGSQAAVTIENNKLYELSITDGLTKLFVHRYFQARLSEEILRARRYNLDVSMVMIDIDNFKKFNDTYGHQVGDIVLQKVASTIKETVRTGVDIPCRYGGEEMTVILPETNAKDAAHTAERIRAKIADISIPHENSFLNITVSIGVASYPKQAHDKESLIKLSDQALYESKANGKNRVTLINVNSEN